jgi:hypothetical protein
MNPQDQGRAEQHAADERALADLLSSAEAAHGQYEARELGGEFDQEWPRWYADFLLQHGIDRHLGATDMDQLAGQLAECDEAYRREQPAMDWAPYYARRLLAGKP